MIRYYVVNACSHPPNESCTGCDILDYAEVDRLPVVLFFNKRVLKAEVIGGFETSATNPRAFADRVHHEFQDACKHATSSRRRRFLDPFIFHIMNILCLGSFSSTLRDLWRAQGVEVTIRRDLRHPSESWRRYFELKKEEWKATGLMATLLSAAAAAMLAVLATGNYPIPMLLCLASLICDLGSAMAGTTLICCFDSVRSMRLAWFQGGVWFILALSSPSGWMRWGIGTFLGSLLAFVWASQPAAAKLLGTILIAAQFICFFILPLMGQTFRVWGAVQLFTLSLPLSPELPTRTANGKPVSEKGESSEV